jgi:hypothetical protein
VTVLGQDRREASRAAAHVDGVAGWQRGQDAPDDRLVHVDQRVAGLVVVTGPVAVPGDRVDLAHLPAAADLAPLVRVQDGTHLGDAGGGEAGAELAGVRAEQSVPLEAEQERHGVWVGHAETL